jgi:ubiquitin thioesterase OTU1
MIRRIIPSDNSCLFNSIAYALDDTNPSAAHELRSVVAGFIMSDPDTYNEAVLERGNKAYCDWILKDTSWGGDVELGILADYYNIEIVAINVITGIPHFYGSQYGKQALVDFISF